MHINVQQWRRKHIKMGGGLHLSKILTGKNNSSGYDYV